MDPRVIGLIILLFLSAFFSGVEIALTSVSKLRAKSLVEQKKRGAAALKKLKDNPKRMIITILIGNNIVNIGASALATVVATEAFGSSGVGIAAGVMTLLVLIFGEITPKNYAVLNAEKVSLLVAEVILLLSYVIFPFVWLFEKLTNIIMRILGSTEESPIFSKEDLKAFVQSGVEEKKLGEEEKEMIESALEFRELTAKDTMTPRTKIFCLNEKMDVYEAMKLVDKNVHTRIPIFKDDKDKITGVVYLKDFFRIAIKPKKTARLSDIAKDPVFVNQETTLKDVFKKLQGKRRHMAIVLDEYGGTEGIVTMEDIVEEIMGEIFDETDIAPRLIRRKGKNKIIVHGDTDIEYINDFFNVMIPVEKHAPTINGFILKRLKGHVKRGSKCTLGNVVISPMSIRHGIPVRVVIEKKERTEESIENNSQSK